MTWIWLVEWWQARRMRRRFAAEGRRARKRLASLGTLPAHQVSHASPSDRSDCHVRD